MMSDFREMDFRGLVAPLLYQDFSEKNSMHFGNLNEAQLLYFGDVGKITFVSLMISFNYSKKQNLWSSNESIHVWNSQSPELGQL